MANPYRRCFAQGDGALTLARSLENEKGGTVGCRLKCVYGSDHWWNLSHRRLNSRRCGNDLGSAVLAGVLIADGEAHGDEFFRRRGMDRDGLVELGFGRAHADRDADALDDFGRVRADHMRA